MSPKVFVKGLAVGPLQENCWLLTEPQSRCAVLVDPGDEAPRLLEALRESECELKEIWLTHAHFDHVGAVAALLRATSVPVLLHPLVQRPVERATESAARFGLHVEQPMTPTVDIAEGDQLRLGAATFHVWHVPGHAPGHVAFIGEGLCVSGDVLFAGSIGRTDLPFCDPHAMDRSLERLATLPPVTRILPGHGDHTTIARERAANPFLRRLVGVPQ